MSCLVLFTINVLFTSVHVNTDIQYDHNTDVSTCHRNLLLFNADIIFAMFLKYCQYSNNYYLTDDTYKE